VWRDYSVLTVKPDDAVGNARAPEFEYNRRLARLGKPLDRNEVGHDAMTVTPTTTPSSTRLVFPPRSPAAVLRPPRR